MEEFDKINTMPVFYDDLCTGKTVLNIQHVDPACGMCLTARLNDPVQFFNRIPVDNFRRQKYALQQFDIPVAALDVIRNDLLSGDNSPLSFP